jgi:hypothetical protein
MCCNGESEESFVRKPSEEKMARDEIKNKSGNAKNNNEMPD